MALSDPKRQKLCFMTERFACKTCKELGDTEKPRVTIQSCIEEVKPQQRRVLQYIVSKHNKPELSPFLYLPMLPSQCGTTMYPLPNQLCNNTSLIQVTTLQKIGVKHQGI